MSEIYLKGLAPSTSLNKIAFGDESLFDSNFKWLPTRERLPGHAPTKDPSIPGC